MKMSADELARRIGKDRSTVYRYESGDIDKVSVDMLWPLARALDTSPAYLIGQDESAGVIAPYTAFSAIQVRHLQQWIMEIGHVDMSDEENREIINFAKYLIHRRNLEN